MYRDIFGIWYQVTFDALDRTIERCPDELWLASMWDVSRDPATPRAVLEDGSPHPLGNEVLSAVWKHVWHGLVACEANFNGRPPAFRSSFAPSDPAWRSTAIRFDGDHGGGEALPLEPPSRAEMHAYVGHNRVVADLCLDGARDIGDGTSTLAAWTGPTSLLLSMFHGNACHLVGHSSSVETFVLEHT